MNKIKISWKKRRHSLPFLLLGVIVSTLFFSIFNGNNPIDKVDNGFNGFSNYNPKSSGSEINITTPENETYTEPMSGSYYGSYSFDEDDTNAQGTEISFVDSTNDGNNFWITDVHSGHKKVLTSYGTSGDYGNYIRYDFEAGISEGTIEYWYAGPNGKRHYQSLVTDSGLAIRLFSDNLLSGAGGFQYHDTGTNKVEIKSHDSWGWYHIRIDFNCTSDTWSYYIDGIKELDEIPFYGSIDANTISYFEIENDEWDSFLAYFDAFGFSWDPNYNIGDNLNEGLLLTYDTNTNFEWQGYSLDGQVNKTILGNKTIPMPSDGSHSIQVFGNTTGGTIYESETRYFIVNTTPYIDIINPENLTYTKSIGGHYPATYGFENYDDNRDPIGWTDEFGWGGSYVQVNQLVDGHKDVLELYDNSDIFAPQSVNSFSSQCHGTIEYWMRSSDASFFQSLLCRIPGDLTTFSFGFNADEWQYYNGSSYVAIPGISGNPTDNKWYHIRIHFRGSYGSTYQGLTSQYTWKVSTEGEESDVMNFLINDDLKSIQLRAGSNADSGYSLYVDAFGFSWDQGYTIGDNLEEGLLLTYDTNTNFEWQGYSLDEQANKTILGNRTISIPSDGPHSIQVFGNSTGGTMYKSDVRYFSVFPINIITPENKIYTEPMSGYYPATYGFENDKDGSIPEGWIDVSDPGSWVRVKDSHLGHEKVIQLYKSGYQSYGAMNKSFSNQVSGTHEVWALTDTTTIQAYAIRLREYSAPSSIIAAGFDVDGKFWASNGSTNAGSTLSFSANQWYHFKVDFNCTTDKYDLTIRDSAGSVVWEEIDLQFYIEVDYIDHNSPNTNWGSSGTMSLYIDAIGYSWDPDYNIGDNLKEGLLLSFDNSTTLDWQGYSLDGQENSTILGNTTIPMPSDGLHSIQVFGNSTEGTMLESDVRYFMIDYPYSYLPLGTTDNVPLRNPSGLEMDVDMNEPGYVEITRDSSNLVGISIGSAFRAHYFYNITFFNTSMVEDGTIINSAKIRLYYDPTKVSNPYKLRVLHHIYNKWIWEELEINSVNTDENYVEFTTTEFSVFCLVEVYGRDPSDPEDLWIWIFIMDNLVFFIILGTIGISAPALYVITSKKKKKKMEVSKKGKSIRYDMDLEEKSRSKKEELIRRTWKPEETHERRKTDLNLNKIPLGVVTEQKEKITPKKKPKKKIKTKVIPTRINAKAEIEKLREIQKTESEIEIEKKEDFCQVHRGPLIGITYVCPKCRTKYCLKCANTLMNKEEKCWSCNSPIVIESDKSTDQPIDDKSRSMNGSENLLNLLEQEKPLETLKELNEMNIISLSEDFIRKLNQLKMAPEDKKEFLKEMLSFTSKERDDILNRMFESDSKDFLG